MSRHFNRHKIALGRLSTRRTLLKLLLKQQIEFNRKHRSKRVLSRVRSFLPYIGIISLIFTCILTWFINIPKVTLTYYSQQNVFKPFINVFVISNQNNYKIENILSDCFITFMGIQRGKDTLEYKKPIFIPHSALEENLYLEKNSSLYVVFPFAQYLNDQKDLKISEIKFLKLIIITHFKPIRLYSKHNRKIDYFECLVNDRQEMYCFPCRPDTIKIPLYKPLPFYDKKQNQPTNL